MRFFQRIVFINKNTMHARMIPAAKVGSALGPSRKASFGGEARGWRKRPIQRGSPGREKPRLIRCFQGASRFSRRPPRIGLKTGPARITKGIYDMTRYLPLAALLAIIVGFAAYPRQSDSRVTYLSCEVPTELAGTETGPLVEHDEIQCEAGVEARHTTRRMFGFSETTELARTPQLQGNILAIGGALFGGQTEMNAGQILGCLQYLEMRILAAPLLGADGAASTPGAFRVACVPADLES